MSPLGATFEKYWSGKPEEYRSRWLQWLAWTVLALAIALPRLAGLSRLVTPDEHLWLARSANYYMALSQGQPAWTYQSEHPGVTVMWAGAAGFLVRYPQYRSSGLGQVDSNEFNRYLRNVKKVSLLELLVACRIFMILGQTLILLVSYMYASRLLGGVPAFLSFLLIAFEPFHAALTRLLHLDGLMGNLMLLSLLAIYSYIERRRFIDLAVSAIAAGLGLLTKSPAVLLAPVMGLLITLAFWKERESQPNRSPAWLAKNVVRVSAAWGLVMVITIFALWPALWVKPLQTIRAIVVQGAGHFETDANTPRFFNGAIIPSNEFGIQYWYFYPISYLMRSSPVVLAGLFLGAWAFLKKRPPLASGTPRFVLLGLLLFCGVFTVAMGAGDDKFERYLLPVYAPLDIIAGLGWSSLVLSWGGRTAHRLWRYAPYLIALAAIAVQALLTLNTFPYYLSYYNPLLGGGRQAQNVLPIGWGEGLDQAAHYLNKKPNSGELKALSYYASGCFSYYFNGRVREVTFSMDLTPEDWQKFIDSDYVVVYISQRQRQMASAILDYVASLDPEHTIRINGLDYVQIYKIHP